MILGKLAKSLAVQKQADRKAELHRNLIRHEAKIGGRLFGAVAPGGRREFFCLDEHTWVWHEEWVDSQGLRQIRNTRYDIRPNGILKAQNGQHYQPVGLEEARHLRDAVRLYIQQVKAEVYNIG